MDFCEFAVALGLSFAACDTAPVELETLPEQDPALMGYKRPPAPEPPPPPPPKVIYPPVVIEKEVKVPAPAPPSKTIIKTEYIEVPREIKPPVVRGPDPYEMQLQQVLLQRYANQTLLRPEGSLQPETPTVDLSLDPPAEPAALEAPAEPLKYQAPGVDGSKPIDNSRIFAADRVLVGILEGGINSQLSGEGSVVIQISANGFGYHGRNILVPKGTRLLCDYKSARKAGQTRIGFNCHRMLLGGSRVEFYKLATKLGDVQGYAGLSGEVDNRWWEKYGTSVITTGISAAVQTATALTGQLGEDGDAAGSALTAISENFGLLSAQFLEETVDLKPIIRISQGTRVLIRPGEDWYFPKP